jgi:hypothetical protein
MGKIPKALMVLFCCVLVVSFSGCATIDTNMQTMDETNNAKQILVTKSAVALQPPDDTGENQGDTIEVTLKNIGFNVVQRIDLAIKWFTKDGYFLNEERIDDFTDGQIITPKSDSDFKKVVNLQKHTVNETFTIYVKRAKFRDYIYFIGKQRLPIDGSPRNPLPITNIQRFDNLALCTDFLNNNKSNYIDTTCSPQNETITKMIDYQATSEQYCVQYALYNEDPVRMIIDIVPAWVKQDASVADGFTQIIKENGARGNLTCVSSQGEKQEYFNNFDEAATTDNTAASTEASGR